MVATIGLSQVLFVFTALPFIRPKNLFKPFPVPVDISFHIGTYLFTPGQVVTLIVAPLVAVGLAAFVKWSPWGLAMRAMAENADSARLSGVWVRRTSTVAWTLAGVLSAFTAILAAPGQTSSLTEVLSPELLLLALTAAMVGAMVNLTVGLRRRHRGGRHPGDPGVEPVQHGPGGPGPLRHGPRWSCSSGSPPCRSGSRREDRSTWLESARNHRTNDSPLRKRVGTTGVVATVVVVALLPFVISTGRSFLLSQICIYAVIALSLTVLTGWAGQVSLGQFGLVACGALMAAHLGSSVPLVLLMPFAGAVTAVIAVLVGLPALRVRGLYLAVSTLAFSLWFMGSVLATPCWNLPLVGKSHVHGPAQPPVDPDRRPRASSGSSSGRPGPSPGSPWPCWWPRC